MNSCTFLKNKDVNILYIWNFSLTSKYEIKMELNIYFTRNNAVSTIDGVMFSRSFLAKKYVLN